MINLKEDELVVFKQKSISLNESFYKRAYERLIPHWKFCAAYNYLIEISPPYYRSHEKITDLANKVRERGIFDGLPKKIILVSPSGEKDRVSSNGKKRIIWKGLSLMELWLTAYYLGKRSTESECFTGVEIKRMEPEDFEGFFKIFK